jgi:preprotein translocase subunit SecA
MMVNLLEKILRMGEGKVLRDLAFIAELVNQLEPDYEKLTDAELGGLTKQFKQRLSDGEDLDDLMVEAFAAVREAAKRTLGQRHFDVQIMGGAALHQGNIAEMKTGEGKTLVATLPVYLNALVGRGVHVVTVNDYLAKYQSELMGRIYRFLGMSVGCAVNGQSPEVRKRQYLADITYGTNNEFGFDYLRDNMAWTKESIVQRDFYFALVDEVDSILIDEARTPLIISGRAQGDLNKYYKQFATIAEILRAETDYEVDEKKRTVSILESGIDKIERTLGLDNLYESLNTPLVGFAQNAIRAKELFALNKDYIIENGEVKIVDEHTGRVLEGRRYSEGMHQAIEAKESVEIKEENQTYATITLQNYFRMYEKLAGMTGTAETEAAEFQGIYKLGVIPIPTNQPMIRIDHVDLVYRNENGKFKALVADIVERHKRGQPILVGTISVEKSELVSQLLKKAGIAHNVLNAKNHQHEASIVAEAGRKGSVTVSTNMAGRGTDIMLGGNPEFIAVEQMRKQGYDAELEPEKYEAAWPKFLEKARAEVEKEHNQVVELGGLYVLGTERHESRRIDNQLRGRSGRQGDPGESRFYLAMTDDLMRLFNSSMAERMMALTNFPEDEPLESKLVAKSILRAQTQVEARNFEIRKNVLQYDDVMNKQREVIYAERQKVLEGQDLAEQILGFMEDVVSKMVERVWDGESLNANEANIQTMNAEVKNLYPARVDLVELSQTEPSPSWDVDDISELILADMRDYYREREELISAENMRKLERQVVLSVLDRKWREHLYDVDYLKEGIGLRSMAQKDPLVEYRSETSLMFNQMNFAIREESLRFLLNIQFQPVEEAGSGRSKQDGKTQPKQVKADANSRPNQSQLTDSGPNPDSNLDRPSVKVQSEGDREPQSGLRPRAVPKLKQPSVPRGAPLSNVQRQAHQTHQLQTNQIQKTHTDGLVFKGTAPNAPCPCGSGKKYKLCHGLNDSGLRSFRKRTKARR